MAHRVITEQRGDLYASHGGPSRSGYDFKILVIWYSFWRRSLLLSGVVVMG